MKRKTGEIFTDHDGNVMIVEETDAKWNARCQLCAYNNKLCYEYLNETGDCSPGKDDTRDLIFRHYLGHEKGYSFEDDAIGI